jgi:hypothetical protein
MQEKKREGKRIFSPRNFKSHRSLKRLKKIIQATNATSARRRDIVINCPNIKDHIRKGKYKRHHVHAAEDDERVQKNAKEDD